MTGEKRIWKALTVFPARPSSIATAPRKSRRDLGSMSWRFGLFRGHIPTLGYDGAIVAYQGGLEEICNLPDREVDRDGIPLLEEGGTVLIESDGALIGTGHSDVFSEDGTDWLVHHAYDSESDYEPVLNIRRLIWDQAGWPSACKARE